MKTITLEMSLKPFRQTDDASLRARYIRERLAGLGSKDEL